MSKKSGRCSRFSLRRIFLQRTRVNQNHSDIESGTSKDGLTDKTSADVGVVSIHSVGDRNRHHSGELQLIEVKENSHNEISRVYCAICYIKESPNNPFFKLDMCEHKFCVACLKEYFKNEITESRTDIACPQCPSSIHPNNIQTLLDDLPDIKAKYEDFMLRRFLVTDPDSRWCPAPDCSFAVIATGCASCPQIQCERPNCGVSFCYHCKAEWHPDQTCDAARCLRQNLLRMSSISCSQDSSTRRDEIKPCPRCQVLIIKMNDGSCNHMVCSVCGAEFCWLCMKEVSDLHYLSPSGCTFWGKKPWSRKKKIVWQIGTLIGAPVGIALLAGIAVPSMVIGIPVWVGRKLLDRYKTKTRKKRNFSVTIGVIASIFISPFLAGLAIAVGVPILLFYVYGVVPVSLCRAGCSSASSEEFKFDENFIGYQRRVQYNSSNAGAGGVDGVSLDAESKLAESIGEVSLSATSGSFIEVTHVSNASNILHSHRESTIALAGSIKNQKIEGFYDMLGEGNSISSVCEAKSTGKTPNSHNSSLDIFGTEVVDSMTSDLKAKNAHFK